MTDFDNYLMMNLFISFWQFYSSIQHNQIVISNSYIFFFYIFFSLYCKRADTKAKVL